jgi:hypothetical protein
VYDEIYNIEMNYYIILLGKELKNEGSIPEGHI